MIFGTDRSSWLFFLISVFVVACCCTFFIYVFNFPNSQIPKFQSCCQQTDSVLSVNTTHTHTRDSIETDLITYSLNKNNRFRNPNNSLDRFEDEWTCDQFVSREICRKLAIPDAESYPRSWGAPTEVHQFPELMCLGAANFALAVRKTYPNITNDTVISELKILIDDWVERQKESEDVTRIARLIRVVCPRAPVYLWVKQRLEPTELENAIRILHPDMDSEVVESAKEFMYKYICACESRHDIVDDSPIPETSSSSDEPQYQMSHRT